MNNRHRLLSLIALLCCAVFLIPDIDDGLTYARRGKKKKKAKSGVVDKGTYVDNKYGFSIDIVDGWSVKVSKEGERLRFIAQKKNYATPLWLTGGELLTVIPTIKLYTDTTNLTARQFADSLSSRTFKSKRMRALRNEFRIYNKRVRKPRFSTVRLRSGVKGLRCSMTRKYIIETGRGPHPEYMQGDLVFVKRGDKIFVISCVCLSLYYKDNNAPLFQRMFDSFAFVE